MSFDCDDGDCSQDALGEWDPYIPDQNDPPSPEYDPHAPGRPPSWSDRHPNLSFIIAWAFVLSVGGLIYFVVTRS